MRLASLLLLAGPLTLALVFFVLREPPPTPGCDDPPTPATTLDAYRAGLGWLFVASELVTLAVLTHAARRACRTRARARRSAVLLAAGAAVAAIAVLPITAFVVGTRGEHPLSCTMS